MSHRELPDEASFEQIAHHLNVMKQARLGVAPPAAEVRIDRIKRAIDLLQNHSEELAEAVSQDFGNRSRAQTLLADVGSAIASLHFNMQNVEQWMQVQPAFAPFPGAQARVQYQPLGVVGIVSPWNFPITLAFSPLGNVFAAGNSAMLKPSEHTPRTSALLAELIARYFEPTELTTVVGGAETGAAFSAQAFDHLIFTGSTAVARHVMRAAADNLVPLTLELGGKSPVIVADDADLDQVVERVFTVKTFNAGQICLSPDYLLIREDRVEALVHSAQRAVAKMYPSLLANPDYTSIINPANFARLHQLLDDARDQGATVVAINPEDEDLSDPVVRKIAPTLVLGATDSMGIMQQEIFGPLLPIVTYRGLDDALDYVNAKDRPLAVYFFGQDQEQQALVADRTTSGALVINDVMSHVFVDALPFGGVGPSGMGHYHGEYGFRALSHAKPVFTQSQGAESNLLMRAPYSDAAVEQIKRLVAGE